MNAAMSSHIVAQRHCEEIVSLIYICIEAIGRGHTIACVQRSRHKHSRSDMTSKRTAAKRDAICAAFASLCHAIHPTMKLFHQSISSVPAERKTNLRMQWPDTPRGSFHRTIKSTLVHRDWCLKHTMRRACVIVNLKSNVRLPFCRPR